MDGFALAEYETLRRMAAMTFGERLQWMEGALELARLGAEQASARRSAAAGGPAAEPDGTAPR